jgi:hypothetical protein
MANAFFDAGLVGLLDWTIDWIDDDIRVMLVKSTYIFDDTDEFISDMGSVDNGRSISLIGKTVIDGVVDAFDTSIVAVAEVDCDAYVVFKHSGDDGTARLIEYIDTPVAGFPMTPAVGQILNIVFDNGPEKMFDSQASHGESYIKLRPVGLRGEVVRSEVSMRYRLEGCIPVQGQVFGDWVGIRMVGGGRSILCGAFGDKALKSKVVSANM